VRFGNSAAALEGFIDPAAKNKRGQKSFKSKVFAITLFSGKREGEPAEAGETRKSQVLPDG
jgi:hypothetical protein